MSSPELAPLPRVVRGAAARLASADRTGGGIPFEQRRRIEAALRAALQQHRVAGGSLSAAPAVTIACAHLAAGDLENAYNALLTASDLLR